MVKRDLLDAYDREVFGPRLHVEGRPATLPSFGDLTQAQVERAKERGRRDYSGAPRWAWAELDRRLGLMIPGNLYIVGAITGNGKTAFLMSQMDVWNEARVPVLYVPLEVDPEDVRRRWAAWKLGLDAALVEENAWGELPEGAQDAHESMMEEQAHNPFVHFPPDRRITLTRLAGWVREAVKELGIRAVVVDHFHRMDFGNVSENYRVHVTEAARELKDMAREHEVVMVAAAQLNRSSDVLDRYIPPTQDRLKESSGLGEEADGILMLSRRLKQTITRDMMLDLKQGQLEVRGLEEPGAMVVTVRKGRRRDDARDRYIRLYCNAVGRVYDAPRYG